MEAINLIHEARPNEDPAQNLIDVLNSGRVKLWIVDNETGERIPIPPDFPWHTDSQDFYFSPYSGDVFAKVYKGRLAWEWRHENQMDLLLTGTRYRAMHGQLQIEKECHPCYEDSVTAPCE